MKNYINSYLPAGSAEYRGTIADAVDFTLKHQLLDRNTWKSFVEVFRSDSDAFDRGWRDEYFGKMMRGACLTYRYTGGEELYEVLEGAVRDLLSICPASGAFTTYNEETFFSGWDIWGRKYVLTGLQHFYAICKDEKLKEEIIIAMKAHADDLLVHIGSGENQIDITATSNFWLGVNSCSVLEPIVELYKLTGEKRYLDFAEYIIGTGGCSGGDLAALAVNDEIDPFMYPETKAYETMSFFEGLLAYYELTGKEYYFEAVKKFVEAVARTDITAIGCSGCTHELFDHSYVKQTEYSDGIMQETCVTVTWMRLNARLFLLTGKVGYYDRIELSGYNALYGSMNKNQLPQLDMGSKELLPPLPFDSYSPLYMNRRGRGIGGLKRFAFGGHYGCCACIASAGTALMPLLSVVESDDGICFNGYQNGTVNTRFAQFEVNGDFSADTKIVLKALNNNKFKVKLRLPYYADETQIYVNDAKISSDEEGYAVIDREWTEGDVIKLRFVVKVRKHDLNNKVAFTYGPFVLARDCMKEDADITVPVVIDDHTVFEMAASEAGENVRFLMSDGKGGSVLLTDYASCGNDWSDVSGLMTVWLDKA